LERRRKALLEIQRREQEERERKEREERDKQEKIRLILTIAMYIIYNM
jgi:hypothetical protein